MSNLGLDIAMKKHGIKTVKTKVGDRYVLEEMMRGGYSLGGEQSGHIIFLDDNTTGDGILTGLHLGIDNHAERQVTQSSGKQHKHTSAGAGKLHV